MNHIIGFKASFKNLLLLGISVILIAWLSVFIYGTFYYLYVPPVAHTRPVHFQFDTSCQQGICGFLTADVKLVKEGYHKLLMRGQPYHVVLDLEMPDSEVNQKLGMFMVKLTMLSKSDMELKSSFRSALLTYKSTIIRSIYTFILSPFLLTGASTEKQLLSVSLFENYEESHEEATHTAFVEVHSRNIEIYSATLRIHADFSGLRYLMYYWPSVSATFGIISNFYFLSLIALFSWFRLVKWNQRIRVADDLPTGKVAKDTKQDFKTPVPLKPQQSPNISTSVSSSESSSSKAYEVLQNLSKHAPEKKTATKESGESPGYLNLSTSGRARVLDVDAVQNMSPISEEGGSLDSTPISEFTVDAILKKQK